VSAAWPGRQNRCGVADKDEANKAKQHTRWLTSSLAGARVKGEQWYPVKFDSVVKQCVLDQDVNSELVGLRPQTKPNH